MNRSRWTVLVVAGGLLALGGARLAAEGEEPSPLATAAPKEARALHFVTSGACADCHGASTGSTALKDEDGRWVGPWDLWRSSMMANSARDPLYRAVVSAESAATPARSAEIEARCLACHAPLATVELERRGEFTPGLATLRGNGLRAQLALDGVACTACHQIEPDNLGTTESFNGGYAFTQERQLYGPHEGLLTEPMQEAVEFTPVHGAHVMRSELCGTCHTQLNESYLADGKSTGTLYPEQATFLEWRNSSFAKEGAQRTCQACHVPAASGDGKALSGFVARGPDGKDHTGVGEREPLGRHLFVGGNTLVPAILRDNPDLIPTGASPEAFDATIAAARETLRRSARVQVGELELASNTLKVPVRLDNLTGHKLPTGHPTRRMWLHVRVVDGDGRRVFDSGAHDQQGRIVDGAGRALPSELVGGPVQHHLRLVEREDQVQIYEAIAHDPAKKPTYLLTRATGHLKDNRLLPAGWTTQGPDPYQTIPKGVGGDPYYVGGSHTLVYKVPVGDRPGPFAVQVKLLFQTLGARYAAELFEHQTPEMKAFRELYQAADRTPVTLAEAAARLESR
jgi:mono/diheme cytochrome c family protein